ncbi:MAG TPA: twin-arginine translocase subunit TatC, partial [Pseudomonas sp.]|nr:twin-arginine translocase subunit TatC [Pseudomonas sp.]
ICGSMVSKREAGFRGDADEDKPERDQPPVSRP